MREDGWGGEEGLRAERECSSQGEQDEYTPPAHQPRQTHNPRRHDGYELNPSVSPPGESSNAVRLSSRSFSTSLQCSSQIPEAK